MTTVPERPPIEWRTETVSTNVDVRSSNFRHGSMVATLNQTGGRGRLDRTWVCPAGQSLAMSLVIDTMRMARATDVTWLPLLAGLALVDVIEVAAPHHVGLKWPNDVLIDGLKVAGILCELTGDGRVIVGVGINVGIPIDELPVPTATSLSIHGSSLDASTLAERWMARMLAYAESGMTADVLAQLTRALDTVGRTVRAELPDGSVLVGRATGLAADGALVLDVAGAARTVSAGDVTHLRHQESVT